MRRLEFPRKRRWFVYGFLLLAAIVVSIYYAFWVEGAKTMRGAVTSWISDQRAAGLTVNHSDIRTEGFPFKLRAGIDDVEFSDSGGDEKQVQENWRWRTQRLHIDILPRATDRLTFSAAGPQEIFVRGAGEWRIESDDHSFVLANDDARLWTASLESGPVMLTALDQRKAVSAESFSLNASPAAANHDDLELKVAIFDAVISLNGAPVEISSLEADFDITKTPELNNGERWKDAGGVLRLNRVHVQTEGVNATLSGILSLDAAGYPEGRLDAEIAGPAGIGRLLGKVGLLRHDEAAATQAALALMAVVSGGKISAPIILKNGEATLGGVKIADLPRVD